MALLALIRGGGDVASGVAIRLYRAGIQVVITELPQPLAVRRCVSFAEAIYRGKIEIENVRAKHASGASKIIDILSQKEIPIICDSECQIANELQPDILVDARMTKRPPERGYPAEWLMIGLGPGFNASQNCDAAVETKRGHFLGRVYWQGLPEPDSGIPEPVQDHVSERVLRAPVDGIFHATCSIGSVVEDGSLIGEINGFTIKASFRGLVRGLIHDGVEIQKGTKIGDLDPRMDSRLAFLVSDKSLAIGGGVLEAILSVPRMRKSLCGQD